MNVAVVYEESYTLYDQFYERSIWEVVAQRDNETNDEFYDRMNDRLSKMKSIYSHYVYETSELVDD